IMEPAHPLARNKLMVARADFLIATPKTMKEVMRGSGTWATIRYARKADIPILLLPR
ncbi:hypothetical protein LCGC14_1722330, partial [marine sediment metagenome]